MSLFTAEYSAATAAPLKTELRAARSAELRASARKGGKKKNWADDTQRIFFVVICVFQVKLQIRGHFHYQGLQAGGMRGKRGHSYGQFIIISVQFTVA